MGSTVHAGATGVVHDHVRRSQRFNTLFMLGLPLLALVAQPPAAPQTIGLVLGLVACVALHCVAIGWGVTPWPGLVTQVEWLLIVGSVLLALIAFTQAPFGWIWFIVPGTAAADLAGLRRPIRPFFWSASIATVTGVGALLLTWDETGPDAAALTAVGAAAFVLVVGYGEAAGPLLAVRTTEAEQARERLAALEERARVAEELHDVLGRALEVVVLKSELADRVLEQAPDRARHELREVRQVAQRAVTDMRSTVRHFGDVDAAKEMVAARGLLESAGVSVVVVGDPEDLPTHTRSTLGRVVREAVTNVLRHSHATTVRIAVSTTDDAAVLTIHNDGVSTVGDGADGGTGLAALQRHLARSGGELSTQVAGESFHLRATLPR